MFLPFMFSIEINSIFDKLGGFGVEQYTLKPSDPMRAPVLGNYSDDLVNGQWYANQRSITGCLGCDFFEDLSKCLTDFYSQDSQFPPDIVKCCRLYSLMREFNPSGILEIGCGTSSLVISKYIECQGVSLPSMCVDANKDWIDLTRKKMSKVSSVDIDKTEWVEWSDEECARIKNFVGRTDKLFIYLDARLVDEDKYEGMGSLLSILEGFTGNLAVLIDARFRAVLSLNKLAYVLRSNLMVASNCLIPSESDLFSAFHRYQHMGSFTYVIKQ